MKQKLLEKMAISFRSSALVVVTEAMKMQRVPVVEAVQIQAVSVFDIPPMQALISKEKLSAPYRRH